MVDSFDVLVVGAGPGGYVAAIRCAQLGLNTACVDNQINHKGEPALGGTCLNVGCIPSKALLESTEQYHKLIHSFPSHGIKTTKASVDVHTMQQRKESIVEGLTSGIAQLFKANKVTSIHGFGRLTMDNTVNVLDENEKISRTLMARHIILAPGSIPSHLPNIPFDHEFVVDSTGALNFEKVPKRLGIIGAGVIGLELGSVWNRLGSEVTLLEALDDFLALADHQVAAEAKRQFTKQGLNICLQAKVNKLSKSKEGLNIHYSKNETDSSIEVDRVVVAIGRRPATEGLISADSGVSVDDRGYILVDDECRTNIENVWAIGDAVRGPMLAHKSSEEGIAVAERIAGGKPHVNLNIVPWVIYTSPEIAWVGLTEQELQETGSDIRVGSFPFAATGRARAMEEPTGFIKMIADAKTDQLLGIHMIGPHVSELINECVLAMEYQASSEDLARTIHAHPSLSEAIHEAALAVDKRAIHRVN
ncbi:MAG: dihydrolipoyl dehydrogenase [Gammaproteobacteria bacterium]|nr:dihydrolipoyl dehydrogenase [Gammaproteobacteria bacterium]MCY4218440.1 dihydrolipoyl dehydrogenase [Gammaproteobacteria bacterium]MCY4274739.1 dihydrolipoyl dehydrogenase [Gammaproteobacteria bacterium]